MPERGRSAVLRTRIGQVVERATRIGFSGTAVLSNAAVLDGRTLTGEVHLRGVKPSDFAALLLVAERAEGGRKTAALDTPVERNGLLSVPLAVPLDSGDGVDLRRGEWRLSVEGRTARGASRPIPTTGTVLPAGRRSPAVWNPRSPVTGRRYRPCADDDGHLLLRVVRFPSHAEVERVQLNGTQLSITGRLVGSSKLARRAERGDVVMVLVRVGAKQRRRFPARVTGGHVSALIPLERLRFTEDTEWVIRLRVAKAKPLVVRRVLTDLREPASVHRYPVARLRGRRRITATYNAKNALILQGRRLPPRQGPA